MRLLSDTLFGKHTGLISSRLTFWRISMRATSVAWPTNLLNSPMCALLLRFPVFSSIIKGEYLFEEVV